MQTGSNFECNGSLIPTGQAALGGRAKLSASVNLFALASATGGIKGGCAASDGPPATPFAGWGYGVHVGASFDLGVAGAEAPRSVAAR
jgi:hypothetical protein